MRTHPILVLATYCWACQTPLNSPVRSNADAAVDPCANLIGTPDEIAATPRARGDLELVALRTDGDLLTADQSTYDRVVADMDAIVAVNPDVAASVVPFTPPGPYMDGKTLTLAVDSGTGGSIKAGKYHAWDCINNYYQLTNVEPYSDYAIVTLKGNYNVGLLASLYGSLPGVTSITTLIGGVGGNFGDNAHLCASRIGDQYQYAIMAAYGDCFAGCAYKKLYCYESTAAGLVTLNADPAECQQWYTQFCQP